MPAFVPLISNVLNANPCLSCLSEKELKAIISYAMRTSAGLTLPQLNIASAGYRSLSKKQMLVALTEMITNRLVPGVSVSDLRKAVRCSSCGSDKAVESALLFLFQTYFQGVPL